MSVELITQAPTTTGPRRVLVEAVAILALCAAVGAGCGWLWFRIWDPPVGVVYGGAWFLDEQGLRQEFTSTGWFVVVAAGAGLLLGLVCALALSRSELVTLGALVIGAVVATFLMWQVGLLLGPGDPREIAKAATDGDRLPGQIEVSGRSPFLVLPATALAVLTLAYATVPRRVRARD